MRFRDNDGDMLAHPEPHFFNTHMFTREGLIFSRDVEAAIEANLFTPIERVLDLVANDVPVKRTVLLSGTYGTGKTLAASVAAALAEANGVTYVYCEKASELPDALEFARQYQSPAAVVFCEDIDRELEGERDAGVDHILNTIDGIDSKSHNIITVLTSNNIDAITAPMLRPGRLDCVIDVAPPDAEAVGRLLRVVGNGSLHPDVNLERVSEVLAGNIPAVITEVVKRAKLVQLSRQARGTKIEFLSEEALLSAAQAMQHQLDLLAESIEREAQQETPAVEAAFTQLVVDAIEQHRNNY
jgi:transitional endoplasmic reticulum ATPase